MPRGPGRTLLISGAIIALVQSMLAGCVAARCEPDAVYFSSRTGTGLTVPVGLDGYERDPSMEIPGSAGGTAANAQRSTGGCLIEPPPMVSEQARRRAEEATPRRADMPAAGSGPAAPGPTPGPSPDQAPLTGEAKEIAAMLERWAEAWSGQDTTAYFSFYAGGFEPPQSMGRTAWMRWREQQLTDPEWVEVRLEDLNVEMLEEGRALVLFTQHYASDVANEARRRLVEVVREGDAWRILRETDAR